MFEFLRDYHFNARNAFATDARQPEAQPVRRHDWRAVKKDKLFFFGGYQGKVEKSNPPTTISYVPTQAMLNGDFTSLRLAGLQRRPRRSR